MAFVAAKIDLVRPTAERGFRRVTLESEVSGALVVRSLEARETPEAAWGLDYEELALNIAPEDLPRFAMAAARALLGARQDAVERFKSICEENEIPVQVICWT
jgi:hypothetical protein